MRSATLNYNFVTCLFCKVCNYIITNLFFMHGKHSIISKEKTLHVLVIERVIGERRRTS